MKQVEVGRLIYRIKKTTAGNKDKQWTRLHRKMECKIQSIAQEQFEWRDFSLRYVPVGVLRRDSD